MSDTLIILNDPPYGTERSFNGLRLAGWLARRDGVEVRVFLIGDAAACAKRGQENSTGLLHHREDACARREAGWRGRRLRDLHGRSRDYRRRARRRMPSQTAEKISRPLDRLRRWF